MNNPLYDALFAPMQDDGRCLFQLPDGSSLTAGAFHEMILRFANALRAVGVSAGDRVVVQATKTPQMLALYGASVATGSVFLPLNTDYKAEELDYFLRDSGARLLLVDPDRASGLLALSERAGVRLESIGAGGSLDALAADCSTQFSPVHRRGADLAALLYTSGTTGRSKGAMMTQDNLLSNARTLVQLWKFSAEDVLLHALPIFHTHGLFVACNVVFLSRAQMIFQPRFEAEQVISALPDATTMMGVPTFYTRLLQDPRLSPELVGHMRLFISGSAPLLAETHQAWQTRTGHAILERYGMTETNMLSSNPYDGSRRPGTVGLPLPDVALRIADPASGAPLPQGATGMIEVKGPNVFAGYWQMPEKTAAEFRADGFFITGDLGVLDKDGYLQIVGRAKDLIISGGFNVYPKEVEMALDQMPGVSESAVIGVPHPDFGEGVLAVLAVADTLPNVTEISRTLRERLAGYKLPKAYVLVPELPRNAMGKVQKAALRAQFQDQFEDAAT